LQLLTAILRLVGWLVGIKGSVTITTQSSTDGAITLSRMHFSGYVGHVTIFSLMFNMTCCLVVGLGLGLGLALD